MTYRAGIVNSAYGFTLTRNLQIQRFGEFVSNPVLEFRRPSRGKVRHRLSRLITVFIVHGVQGPTIVVLALSYTKIDQPSTHTLPSISPLTLEVVCQRRILINKRLHGLQAFRFSPAVRTMIKRDAISYSSGTVLAEHRRKKGLNRTFWQKVTDGPSRTVPTAF